MPHHQLSQGMCGRCRAHRPSEEHTRKCARRGCRCRGRCSCPDHRRHGSHRLVLPIPRCRSRCRCCTLRGRSRVRRHALRMQRRPSPSGTSTQPHSRRRIRARCRRDPGIQLPRSGRPSTAGCTCSWSDRPSCRWRGSPPVWRSSFGHQKNRSTASQRNLADTGIHMCPSRCQTPRRR